jgi:hypothetical protein
MVIKGSSRNSRGNVNITFEETIDKTLIRHQLVEASVSVTRGV